MKSTKYTIGNLFLISALTMLIIGLLFGVLAAITYIQPNFLKTSLGFTSLRPMHVSSAMFWIILGATGCVFSSVEIYFKKETTNTSTKIQWGLWVLAICGIFYSYFTKQFGGREYWEFDPIWALPILCAWLIFLFNFIKTIKGTSNWPVYVWMWTTGIIFFLFTFIENYLWLIPYFRENFITDTTIQWKVNGSLVGAWNQMIYGTAFFLMDRIEGKNNVGRSKLAFATFFIGLTNLMFNWSHHIYTLPTEVYLRYVGYIISMTEWVFFIKIIYDWKQSVSDINKHYHYFPYRFIMASDVWVFLNLGQALLMSIPAINVYTHGTHVTVAHSMGTTIGINSMILFAACFEFLNVKDKIKPSTLKFVKYNFWIVQVTLLLFWLALIFAGVKKAFWQMSENRDAYSSMMDSLSPYFITIVIVGTILAISLTSLAVVSIKSFFSNKTIQNLD